MTPDELRTVIERLPGVEERATWGRATFRVAGHIFLGLAADGTSARVRTSRAEQVALVGSDPSTFEVAPNVGRHGWTEVHLASVDRHEMTELVIDAWRRTAPRDQQAVKQED